jgi:hypothetical protein
MTYDVGLNHSYTSGVSTTPCGASGLLQSVILPFIKGTEVVAEVIGIGDTSELNFAGTLAHFPVGLRRLVVSYTIGTILHTAADGGSGLIVGPHLTGTLVHSTGAWTLTFEAGSAPDAVNITASYLYGYPGADWRSCYQRATRDALGADCVFVGTPTCVETILHNTGLSGTEDVWIGFREYYLVSAAAYGMDLNAYTAYNTNQDWMANLSGILGGSGTTEYSATWQHYKKMPMIPLTTGNTAYWIQSNQQCVKITEKAATGRFMSCYVGFMRRYGTKTDYPYPIVVKGPVFGDENYGTSVASPTLSGLALHGTYNTFCVSPGNSYLTGATASSMTLTPRSSWIDLASNVVAPKQTTNSYPVRPVMVIQKSAGNQLLGDMDGVNFTFGTSLVAEDVIEYSGVRHKVFPDSKLATYYDFFCVAESTI